MFVPACGRRIAASGLALLLAVVLLVVGSGPAGAADAGEHKPEHEGQDVAERAKEAPDPAQQDDRPGAQPRTSTHTDTGDPETGDPETGPDPDLDPRPKGDAPPHDGDGDHQAADAPGLVPFSQWIVWPLHREVALRPPLTAGPTEGDAKGVGDGPSPKPDEPGREPSGSEEPPTSPPPKSEEPPAPRPDQPSTPRGPSEPAAPEDPDGPPEASPDSPNSPDAPDSPDSPNAPAPPAEPVDFTPPDGDGGPGPGSDGEGAPSAAPPTGGAPPSPGAAPPATPPEDAGSPAQPPLAAPAPDLPVADVPAIAGPLRPGFVPPLGPTGISAVAILVGLALSALFYIGFERGSANGALKVGRRTKDDVVYRL